MGVGVYVVVYVCMHVCLVVCVCVCVAGGGGAVVKSSTSLFHSK